MEPITLAQIGCGYWGPNLLRNFSAVKGCLVKWVVDASTERREYVTKNFPRTRAVSDFGTVLADPEVKGLIIATPAHTHFPLAVEALRAGKHIFVEKPLATSLEHVDSIAREAARKNLIVMTGHTFLYNNAVRYVKDLIDRGELGEIRYVYSQRLNLGRIRSDIDAMWNFAPHDVSIIQYWLNDPDPLRVTRHGVSYIQKGIDDVVFVNITYPNNVIGHIHVSWLDPQKTRKIVVVGSKRMVIYNDVADDKIAIYDKGIDRQAVLGEGMDFDQPPPPQFAYRSGDILLPKIEWTEPLRAEAEHFLACLRTGMPPLTGISHARRVVQILEMAQST